MDREVTFLNATSLYQVIDYYKIKGKVIATLTEYGECTPENVERAMSSKIYDLDDLIDIKEYVKHIEEEQRKKAEQKRGKGR